VDVNQVGPKVPKSPHDTPRRDQVGVRSDRKPDVRTRAWIVASEHEMRMFLTETLDEIDDEPSRTSETEMSDGMNNAHAGAFADSRAPHGVWTEAWIEIVPVPDLRLPGDVT
jgi:hypothetical protein